MTNTRGGAGDAERDGMHRNGQTLSGGAREYLGGMSTRTPYSAGITSADTSATVKGVLGFQDECQRCRAVDGRPERARMHGMHLDAYPLTVW